VAYFVLKLRTNYAIKNIDSGCLRVMKKNIEISEVEGGTTGLLKKMHDG
jgi:hypothetical protein